MNKSMTPTTWNGAPWDELTPDDRAEVHRILDDLLDDIRSHSEPATARVRWLLLDARDEWLRRAGRR